MIWPTDDDTAEPPRDLCDCGVCDECARDREAERFATDADAAYDARHDFTD